MSTTNTADAIAKSLRADIAQGKLRSEQPLRQDNIAERFGVSKIPVREALHQLKAEGLVTFIPNRGAAVSKLSAAEVEEIYIMRIALETSALRRATPYLTVADLSQAERILTTIDEEQNVAQWGELNGQFHAILYAPARLPRLMEWVEILHANVARYLPIYLAGMDYQIVSQKEHRAILDACRHGEVKMAVDHLADHLQSASQRLVDFLRREGL